jgi:hypothetical protein
VDNLATHLDQCVANATCALVGVEDIPQFQKELLTIPANNGGWGLPALGRIKECAYIGGAAATPNIQPWEIPAKHTKNFVDLRTKEVEQAIQAQLLDLMQGKTVIASAHRLSTIARMDRLLVLDQGRIVEAGSHAELLAQGGLYADLWQRQTGDFLAAQ